MKRRILNHFAMASAVLLTCATAARGDEVIPITNAGFENPALPELQYPTTIPHWSQGQYDGSAPTVWIAGTSGAGVYDVSTSEYISGTAPEGENMGYLTSATGFDTGVNQVLSATLQADSTYNLSAVVGNPFVYNASLTADWRIELLAGGVLLGSATGPSPVDDTGFATATLTYNSGAEPAQLGQALEIRLLAVAFTPGKQLDFDDVQLTVALGNPVAATGGPYFVALSGGALALDGGDSLPSNGETILTYEWDIDGDGNFDEAITGVTPPPISSNDLQNVYGMTTGANTIRLRVTDSAAKASTTDTTVTLVDTPLEVYRSGGGVWDTSSVNWGTIPGGPYDTMVWANAVPLVANLEGGGGTLTLASEISLFGLQITAGTPRIITASSLAFISGGILLDNGVNSGLNTTIGSGITGGPSATVNAGEILILDAQTGSPQTLGAIAMNCRVSGTGDNRLTLQGDATDASAGAITLTTGDNQQRCVVEKRGAGTWTVDALTGAFNQRFRLLLYDAGRLAVNGGDIPGVEFRLESPDVTLELGQAGALAAPGSRFRLLQGTIDNTSGGPITFASLLRVDFGGTGNFTLVGDSLDFGPTRVALLAANNSVTVAEASSVLTFSGRVTDGGLLTKAGDGTLALTNAVREYTGDTTVAAGTLSISGGTLASALTVNAGAALGLEVGASVISSGTLTLADGAKVKLNGTPTAPSHTLFQATAIDGTPVLDSEIPDHELVVADGGTTLKLNSTVVPPYLFWAAGPFADALTDTDPARDFDVGGLQTGIEWVVAGDPTDAIDDADLAPTFDNTTDPDKFLFVYRRADAAAADTNTTIMVEYGSALSGWTPAVHQGTSPTDINITVDDNFYGANPGIDKVTVAIPRTLADGDKLFTRLNVGVVTP